jgi:hypothetical protein
MESPVKPGIFSSFPKRVKGPGTGRFVHPGEAGGCWEAAFAIFSRQERQKVYNIDVWVEFMALFQL